MSGPCDEDERRKGTQEKALKGYTEERRPVGRPKRRWIDTGDRNARRMLKCKNWRSSAEGREVWRRRIEDVRSKMGCSAKGEEE